MLSVISSAFQLLSKEKKLIATGTLTIYLFYQFRVISHFPETSFLFTWQWANFFYLEHWPDWRIAGAVFLWLSDAAIIGLSLIAMLPKTTPKRYFVLLTAGTFTAMIEMVNVLRDRPEETLQKEIWGTHWLIPILIIATTFALRIFIKQSPSEQNHYLKQRNKELAQTLSQVTFEDLTDIYSEILIIRGSHEAIKEDHNLDSWKVVWNDITGTLQDKTARTIRKGRDALEKEQ